MAFINDFSPFIAINCNTAVSSCYPSTSSIDIDRCNNQPGNVKHRRARATSSNIDDLVRKRTGLSSIVRKRTSFQPSCASARATASAMGLHKLFCCPRASIGPATRTTIQQSIGQINYGSLLYWCVGLLCGCARGALLLTPILPNVHGLTVTVSR